MGVVNLRMHCDMHSAGPTLRAAPAEKRAQDDVQLFFFFLHVVLLLRRWGKSRLPLAYQ
eukprot:SAG31_NODE_32635_length_353_cov_0.838583_1_plen_58_part_10